MGGCFLNDGKMILGCTEHIQWDCTYLLAEWYYVGVGSSLDIHQTYALNLATYSLNSSLLSAVCSYTTAKHLANIIAAYKQRYSHSVKSPPIVCLMSRDITSALASLCISLLYTNTNDIKPIPSSQSFVFRGRLVWFWFCLVFGEVCTTFIHVRRTRRAYTHTQKWHKWI